MGIDGSCIIHGRSMVTREPLLDYTGQAIVKHTHTHTVCVCACVCIVVYRVQATCTRSHGSGTGSRYDWLACGTPLGYLGDGALPPWSIGQRCQNSVHV